MSRKKASSKRVEGFSMNDAAKKASFSTAFTITLKENTLPEIFNTRHGKELLKSIVAKLHEITDFHIELRKSDQITVTECRPLVQFVQKLYVSLMFEAEYNANCLYSFELATVNIIRNQTAKFAMFSQIVSFLNANVVRGSHPMTMFGLKKYLTNVVERDLFV